jgi:cell wall-associated NlpC family hydrolase
MGLKVATVKWASASQLGEGNVVYQARPARGVVAALAVAAVCFAGLAPAQGDPNHDFPSKHEIRAARQAAADKARDVGAIKADLALANQRLQDLGIKAEQATEAYNGAMWKLEQAKKAVQAARVKATASQQRLRTQRNRLGALIAADYQTGGSIAQLGVLMNATGGNGTKALLNQFVAVNGATSAMHADFDSYSASNTLAELYRAQARRARIEQHKAALRAAVLKQRANAAVEAQQAAVTSIAKKRDELIRELAKQQHLSVKLVAQRQRALERIRRQRAAAAAQAAAEAAAAAAAAAAASNAQAAGTPGTTPVPTTSGDAQVAVNFAYAQLGEPYVWAAAGPDSWDCSGLTMGAWAAAGVYLPHYSVAQYAATMPISAGELRPGDLVFWATDPSNPGTIFHVGLYIGGGNMIAAPHTGSTVRIESIWYWETPSFFGRP